MITFLPLPQVTVPGGGAGSTSKNKLKMKAFGAAVYPSKVRGQMLLSTCTVMSACRLGLPSLPICWYWFSMSSYPPQLPPTWEYGSCPCASIFQAHRYLGCQSASRQPRQCCDRGRGPASFCGITWFQKSNRPQALAHVLPNMHISLCRRMLFIWLHTRTHGLWVGWVRRMCLAVNWRGRKFAGHLQGIWVCYLKTLASQYCRAHVLSSALGSSWQSVWSQGAQWCCHKVASVRAV